LLGAHRVERIDLGLGDAAIEAHPARGATATSALATRSSSGLVARLLLDASHLGGVVGVHAVTFVLYDVRLRHGPRSSLLAGSSRSPWAARRDPSHPTRASTRVHPGRPSPAAGRPVTSGRRPFARPP